MAKFGPEDKEDTDRDHYISADGQVTSTPQEAVEASLIFEDTSGTGAGCGQDPANIP